MDVGGVKIKLQWISRFVNSMQLYISYEKYGGLHLVEPSLTAGWLSGRQNYSEVRKFKSLLQINFLLSVANAQHCFSKFNSFLMLFSGKYYYKVVL